MNMKIQIVQFVTAQKTEFQVFPIWLKHFVNEIIKIKLESTTESRPLEIDSIQ